MKMFSLYLPQFHQIPENDEWWGEGFTEWINVKKGHSLYKGHLQPKHPLNDNYYNLMDKQTVEWQTSLMHEYGLYGMIYYHYYFCGKKLLEKPAENLLMWKDIDQPFFFCWANHSWNRSWLGSKVLLQEQTYGDKDEWRKHFEYLLPFFQDKRYEKKDNKPIFMIYDCTFKEKQEMISCFNQWCMEEGFAGIYIIEECISVDGTRFERFKENISDCTKNIYITEPQVGRRLFREKQNVIYKYIIKIMRKLNQKGVVHWLEHYEADDIYNTLLKSEPDDSNIIHGLFFEWDNTPRHGNRGFVINPVSKNKLFDYLNKYKHSEYIIINAWNEWAEGMMMEPTEEHGYRYLEWLKEWKITFDSVIS